MHSGNDGSDCCRRFCSKVRCFCGSLTSCSYFCLIAVAPTELPSAKIVVATMAVGGGVDPLPTEEWQSEMGIFLSPQLASEVTLERDLKAPPKYIQQELGHLIPIPQRLFIVCISRNCSGQGPIQVGYLESWEGQ